MAANSINILVELVEALPFPSKDRERRCSEFLHALSYAPGMDELSSADWRGLKAMLGKYKADESVPADYAALRQLAILVLGRQIVEWGQLGCPDCHENWMRAKYPEDEKDDTDSLCFGD